MKIIITIKNNNELEKADPKRYKKEIEKAERKLERGNIIKTYSKFFGKSEIDLSANEPNDETVEIITRNVEAAKKMFLFYKTMGCVRTTVRFESDIIKEEKED